jgi:hypothetical protein
MELEKMFAVVEGCVGRDKKREIYSIHRKQDLAEKALEEYNAAHADKPAVLVESDRIFIGRKWIWGDIPIFGEEPKCEEPCVKIVPSVPQKKTTVSSKKLKNCG